MCQSAHIVPIVSQTHFNSQMATGYRYYIYSDVMMPPRVGGVVPSIIYLWRTIVVVYKGSLSSTSTSDALVLVVAAWIGSGGVD